MSKLFKAFIKENKQITCNYYLLTLHPLVKLKRPDPGQFFMLSVDNRLDPLLKRPFSLYRWLGGDFQLLYRVVGRGTGILKEKKKGDMLEVMGPFGNGFPFKKRRGKKIILAAGGLGIASVFSLAEAVLREKPLLFYGARTARELLCLNEIRSLRINPIISTDDGTSGARGLITDLLEDFLARQSSSITNYCLYSCGPKPMLKTISALAGRYNLEGYLALEENMACGVGTCLGCVINTRDGYKRVCKEGPVFYINEVIW